MPSLLVHGFEAAEPAWGSPEQSKLTVDTDPSFSVSGKASLRLEAPDGAAEAVAEYRPAPPLDLHDYDELRFWVYADQPADGSPERPFLVELSYEDSGEEHRWLIPVNRPRTWEQRRIHIATDQRAAVTRFRLRCLTNRPFRLHVDELLAVADDPLSDVEGELIRQLGGGIVEVVVEEAPLAPPADPSDLPDRVLLLALSDHREELGRSWNIPQRDSFRFVGEDTVCSVRPPARPIMLEYQVLAAARDRRASLEIRRSVLERVGADTGLRVNGTVLPVWIMPPIPLEYRDRAIVAPFYIRVGTRVETGERQVVPWARRGRLLVAHLSAPEDYEEVAPWS